MPIRKQSKTLVPPSLSWNHHYTATNSLMLEDSQEPRYYSTISHERDIVPCLTYLALLLAFLRVFLRLHLHKLLREDISVSVDIV